MITNKDIRVENGFLIINGDKFPLNGQSPEAIMQIVKDNSDTTPTAESTAPVTSAGIKTYVDTAIGDLTQTGLTGDSVAAQITQLNTVLNGKCSVTTYSWGIGDVTEGGVYELNNLKNTVGLSGKNIVAVGLVIVLGHGNYDYGASVFYTNDTAKLKTAITQSNTTALLYIIYTD